MLWTLLVGLIVGAIAKLLMPGKDPGGFIVTMALGVAGSVIAGWFGRAMGWYQSGVRGWGIVVSIIGAMALLLLYRAFSHYRQTHGHGPTPPAPRPLT